jgi:hypothetical protein
MTDLSPEERAILYQGKDAPLEFLEALLARAGQVHASAVGFAGLESDTYRVYRLIWEQGPAAIPVFERILGSGTPAARLYAAQGLRRLGQNAAANQALAALEACEEKVGYLSGCMMLSPSAGELAAQWRKTADITL